MLTTFGFIFEQMCIRDLKAYTADFNSRVSYYRDRYGLEADLVLHLVDGRYALIECKLGSTETEEGAKHLLEIKSDTTSMLEGLTACMGLCHNEICLS